MIENSTKIDLKVEDGKNDINEERPISYPLHRTINRDIATINRKVNNMDVKKMKHKFSWFKYENKDDVETYRKLLKQNLAKIIRKHATSLYLINNVLPYYVVLDFEATCEAQNPPDYKHEIIEFPAVLVNTSTQEIEDTFRMICRPTIKTKLSEFCKDLTGITQDEVDGAETFPEALKAFEFWLEKHKLGGKFKFAIVTDGPWDMSRFLYVQCLLSNVDYPSWAESWIDLRKVFGKFYEQKKTSLGAMLDHLGMFFEGRPHCGLDDAKNIARVLLQVICDGAVVFPNETLSAAAKTAREAIMDNVDPNQDLALQISQMSLEANRVAIPPRQKLPVHRDVKIERSRKIHALTKNLEEDFGLEGENSASEVLEDKWTTEKALRRPKTSPTKSRRHKKKNH